MVFSMTSTQLLITKLPLLSNLKHIQRVIVSLACDKSSAPLLMMESRRPVELRREADIVTTLFNVNNASDRDNHDLEILYLQSSVCFNGFQFSIQIAFS